MIVILSTVKPPWILLRLQEVDQVGIHLQDNNEVVIVVELVKDKLIHVVIHCFSCLLDRYIVFMVFSSRKENVESTIGTDYQG